MNNEPENQPILEETPQQELEGPPSTAGTAAFWPSILYTPPEPGPHPRWEKLAKAYPKHFVLHHAETIYALPEPLLDAISKEIPKFFTDDEMRFERTLARTAGAGFFLKRPFAFGPLPGPKLNTEDAARQQEVTEWHTQADQSIKQLLDQEMAADGATADEIAAYHKVRRTMIARLKERQWGYAGWLMTEPLFRNHAAMFREKWGTRIAELGAFPVFPMPFFWEHPSPPQNDREFYHDYLVFYRTWNLHSMATWELPIPMRSEMVQPSFYDLKKLKDAGVMLFVPWYLLRDKDLKVRELTEQKLMEYPQPHLDGWLNGRGQLGYKRLADMLKLYVYLELCLKARYADRVERNAEKLDFAMGQYLRATGAAAGDGEDADLAVPDSIKKIRQAMDRRLKMTIDQALPAGFTDLGEQSEASDDQDAQASP